MPPLPLRLAAFLLLSFPFTAITADEPNAAAANDKPAPDQPAGLNLSVHYLDGLTTRSKGEQQKLVFLWGGCHFSLLFTNTSKEVIHLWKPYCPPGDSALRFEFKSDEKSDKIEVARTSHEYTAGMGIPKTIKVLPGDSLVRQIDFASYWSLPFQLKAEESRTYWMRAVYDSAPDAKANQDVAPNGKLVWKGRIETPWERVTITNVTDKPKPEK